MILITNQYKHFSRMYQMNVYKNLKNLSTLLWLNAREKGEN